MRRYLGALVLIIWTGSVVGCVTAETSEDAEGFEQVTVDPQHAPADCQEEDGCSGCGYLGSSCCSGACGHQGGIALECVSGICRVPCGDINEKCCLGNSCTAGGSCIGGTCCSDADNDAICFGSDNCPAVYNPGQPDCDQDGLGDICDDFNGTKGVHVGFDNILVNTQVENYYCGAGTLFFEVRFTYLHVDYYEDRFCNGGVSQQYSNSYEFDTWQSIPQGPC